MRMWLAVLALPLAAAVQEGERRRAPNVGGVETVETGTVTGLVLFDGEKPERKPIAEVNANAFCKECHKEKPPLRENWVFGKNGDKDTLRNVLVYVSKGLEGRTFEPPKDPVILDQIDCIYTPHVVGVMAGQTLEVRNSDATLHNVMSNPRKNPAFNLGMPTKGGKLERVFKVPEFKIQFQCFMHPWMSAWVHVLEHPYYAVTQDDGTFTLKGLPPGEYEVSVLHESSQFEAGPAAAVKVAAGETRKLEFVYKPKK